MHDLASRLDTGNQSRGVPDLNLSNTCICSLVGARHLFSEFLAMGHYLLISTMPFRSEVVTEHPVANVFWNWEALA